MHVAPKYDAKLMNTISIIIPAYNAGLYLKEMLESVLAQTHREFELLIYDDGSRDDTWRIIEQFAARDTRIRATRQENMGQSATLNRGIAEASHALVMVFDADDVMLPNCVAEQIAFLQVQPNLVGAGCLARFINAGGQQFWVEKNPFTSLEAFERAYGRGETIFFRHPGFVFQKDAFLQLESGYREVPQCNDIDFFNRLADVGPILTNPRELVQYRIHDGQITTSYVSLIEPRLTWAWISACNRVRRSRHPEPEYATWRQEVEAWNWWQKFIFTQTALATGYWYEAKVDLISGRKLSFFRKALLAFIVDPLRILAQACQGLRGKVGKQ
jgi:glycosyltransferase involved in cell wall biosynthesis